MCKLQSHIDADYNKVSVLGLMFYSTPAGTQFQR